MAEDKDKDQMTVLIGQKDKDNASSPITKLKIKLCTTNATVTLSSIVMDQSTCKIKGKLISNTANAFHKNSRLKANITLYIKKADRSVKRKAAVDAALYKGMVLIEATLKTFCDSSKR